MLKLSKNTALLLGLFYSNPQQSFFIQEIGRLLGKKPGVFQRTLYTLKSEGILISEYKANIRLFRANPEYPLYDEYKAIIFKSIGAAGNIKTVLKKAGSIEFAFLYGSFAKGQENILSDIDLAIIGSPDEKMLLKSFDNLEKSLKREINYKLYSQNEFQDSLRMKDPFLLAIVQDRIIILLGDEREFRKMVIGQAHKKLKP